MSRERAGEGGFAVRDLAVALCVGWLAFEGVALTAALVWFRAPFAAAAGEAVHHLLRAALESVNIIGTGGLS